jgi:hypothetical protein
VKKNALPSFIKPNGASLEELHAQLDAARAARQEAEDAFVKVRAAFDADPSSEPELLAARDAELLAVEHVGRAERLLKAGEEKAAAERKARLKQRREELEAQLQGGVLKQRREPGVRAEVTALVAAAEARLARRREEEVIASLQFELVEVRKQLGEPVAHSHNAPEAPTYDTIEALGDIVKQHAEYTPMRSYLVALPRYLKGIGHQGI